MKKVIKNLLLITVMTVLCMAVAVTANAETYGGEYEGDIIWSLDTETGVLTIEGTGKMPERYDAPWESYSSDITSVNIGNSVTYGATGVEYYDPFTYCNNIQSITVDENNQYFSSDEYGVLFNKDKTTLIHYPSASKTTEYIIPDSVTRVGGGFSYSKNLETLTFPEYIEVLGFGIEEAEKLETIIFPKKVELFGAGFQNCPALKNVVFPENATDISSVGFVMCPSLGTIKLPENLPYEYFGMENCTAESVIFLEGTTEIDSDGGYGIIWSDIGSIVIPEGVTTIGERFITACNIGSITIPESVTCIEEGAISQCTIGNLTLDLDGKAISSYAIDVSYISELHVKSLDSWLNIAGLGFCNCRYDLYFDGELVTEVTIPEGTTSLKMGAFHGCRSLETVNLPDSIASIGDLAFYCCTALKNINLPESLTSIGEIAFCACKSLESIIIPEGVTEIPVGAFGACFNLKDVTIPKTVTYIDNDAFAWCLSLENIVIPETVTEIDEEAFFNCISLDNVYFYGRDTVIGDENFYEEFYIDETKMTVEEFVSKADFLWSLGGQGYLEFPEALPDELEAVMVYYDYEEYPCTVNGYYDATSKVYADENEMKFAYLDGIVDRGSYGDYINWTLYDTGLLEIIGEGDMPTDNAPWGKYAVLIKEVTISEGITSISPEAFCDCQALKEITVPDSVASIGEAAFMFCVSLEEITLPSGVKTIGAQAFDSCYKLEEIVLSSGLETIGSMAFFQCINLKEITIPDTVVSISEGAFINCFMLEKVIISDGVKEIREAAFGNCLSLKDVYVYAKDTVFNGTFIFANEGGFRIPVEQVVDKYNLAIEYFCKDPEAYAYEIDTLFMEIEEAAITYESPVYSDCTIYGYTASTSEEHANAYAIKFVPLDSEQEPLPDDTEPDNSEKEECDCICHRNKIVELICLLINFIKSFFGIAPCCVC